MGSFQLSIPVRRKKDILPNQQRLLSNLRWIQRAIPTKNRWIPVFGKYVSQIAHRVDALGGNSKKVAPSAEGQWKKAYLRCKFLTFSCMALLATLLVGSGTQTGDVILVGGVPVAAFLAGAVRQWLRKCRPTKCQMLRTLLIGSGIAAVILALLAVFGTSTTQLTTSLIVSAGIAAVTGVISWVKGCWRVY